MSKCFYCEREAGGALRCPECQGRIERTIARAARLQEQAEARTVRARCPECRDLVILTESKRYAFHACPGSGKPFVGETTMLVVIEGSLYLIGNTLYGCNRQGHRVVVMRELIASPAYDPNTDIELVSALGLILIAPETIGKKIVKRTHDGQTTIDLISIGADALPAPQDARS